MQNRVKGQGAQQKIDKRFSKYRYEKNEFTDDLKEDRVATEYIEVFPKTIVNKVPSLDINTDYSMNPYQGCEHGCTYCYARPTHEFWDYDAGIDFERKILIKKNAPQLLEQFFKRKKYIPSSILLSGNTDCYQPCEAKFELTRQLLKVCLKYKHPISIITKNALILRDLKLLIKLNDYNLVKVNFSITTLDEDLRRNLEPRTATAIKKLDAIKQLTSYNIPVSVMVAPIIPGLNSHEILNILKETSACGAYDFGTTMVRLNDTVYPVFKDWIQKVYPLKAEKVLRQIAEVHGDKVEDRRSGVRMRGDGKIAHALHQTLKVGRQKYFPNAKKVILATHHFSVQPDQYKLF